MNQGSSVFLIGLSVSALLLCGALCGQGVFEKRLSPVSSQSAATFKTNRKVALIVGISNYPSGSGFEKLHYASDDATQLAAILTRLGYSISLLKDSDATRGSILKALRQASAEADSDHGTLLFYFSGHGYEFGGKNYLAPVSASDEDLEREGVLVADVEEILAKAKAQRKVMMLDACRSRVEQKGGGGRSFTSLEAAKGFRILNSTAVGNVSFESTELKHGVFSAFVLKALSGEAAGTDGLVTFQDLTAYVTDSMRDWGLANHKTQIPFEASGAGEVSGDFLLAGKLAPAPAAPVAVPAPVVTANHPPSDDTLYSAALASTDPQQMEDAANRISDPTLAAGLRQTAKSYRQINPAMRQMLQSRTQQNDMATYLSVAYSDDPNEIKEAMAKIKSPSLMAALQDKLDQLAAAGTARKDPVAAAAQMGDAQDKLRRNTARVAADSALREGNYAQALPLYVTAAQGGDQAAMLAAAKLYFNGKGTDVNYAEALRWFKQAAAAAANQWAAEGMRNAGIMYEQGQGVPKDNQQAMDWYQKAADLGDAAAMNNIGVQYEAGRGVTHDEGTAVYWYKKAAALDNKEALGNLQRLGVR